MPRCIEKSNEMELVVVTDPVDVVTMNSVYRVEPILNGGYSATKITEIRAGGKVSLGRTVHGEDLFLVVGERMYLGELRTSAVREIRPVQP